MVSVFRDNVAVVKILLARTTKRHAWVAAQGVSRQVAGAWTQRRVQTPTRAPESSGGSGIQGAGECSTEAGNAGATGSHQGGRGNPLYVDQHCRRTEEGGPHAFQCARFVNSLAPRACRISMLYLKLLVALGPVQRGCTIAQKKGHTHRGADKTT